MRFRAEHTFRGIEVAAYERLYFDEAFGMAMGKHVKVARTVERKDLDGPRLHREVRVAPERELPGPIAKVLGTSRLEYVEVLDYVMGSFRGSFRILPAILRDKVDVRGTLEFRAAPGGVTRVLEGDIAVRIFGLGGIVEKFVCADIERSYGEAARFTQSFIDAARP